MWWQANLMRDELSRWLLRYVAFPVISILSSSISVTSCHFLSRDKANGIQQNKPRLNSTVVLVWRKTDQQIDQIIQINQSIYLSSSILQVTLLRYFTDRNKQAESKSA